MNATEVSERDISRQLSEVERGQTIADAIVAPGNGVDYDGNVLPHVVDNLRLVAEMHKAGVARWVVLLGGHSLTWRKLHEQYGEDLPETTEADAAERILVEFGVPLEAQRKEGDSADSIGNNWSGRDGILLPHYDEFVEGNKHKEEVGMRLVYVNTKYYAKRMGWLAGEFLDPEISGKKFEISLLPVSPGYANDAVTRRNQTDIWEIQRGILDDFRSLPRGLGTPFLEAGLYKHKVYSGPLDENAKGTGVPDKIWRKYFPEKKQIELPSPRRTRPQS